MTDVRDVLRRVVPERRVSSTTPIHRGNHKQTVVVEFADHDAVVVQLSSDPESLRTEFTLARAIRERTSLPIPPVVAAGAVSGTGYVVVERAPGVDLHTRLTHLRPADQQSVARSFGRYLAELHEVFPFDGYGRLTVERGRETGEPEAAPFELRLRQATTDWPTWFEAYAREGIETLPDAFAPLHEPLHDAVSDSELPTTPESALFPWDLRPGNALVDGTRVSALLDWGDPLAAAPGLAVAKVEHLVADWYVADGTPLRTAFREGYRSVRTLPDVPTVYRLVAVVRSAVDSRGTVTRPRYPELDGEAAVDFHVERLRALLSTPESTD